MEKCKSPEGFGGIGVHHEATGHGGQDFVRCFSNAVGLGGVRKGVRGSDAVFGVEGIEGGVFELTPTPVHCSTPIRVNSFDHDTCGSVELCYPLDDGGGGITLFSEEDHSDVPGGMVNDGEELGVAVAVSHASRA
jgi:hypothetical protein